MSLSFTIRQARREDHDEILALWRDLLSEGAGLDDRFQPAEDAPARWSADFGEWLRSPQRVMLVVETDAAVVAFATAHLWDSEPILEPALEVFVEYLYVDPRFRRSGIGRDLVERVAVWGSKLGARRLRLRSLARSKEAAAFWEALEASVYTVERTIEMESVAEQRPRSSLGFRGNSP